MGKRPVEPRRLRWSVPAADVSSNRWLDEQENPSRSLQLLIRESIQSDGYIDVVNRPIDQLPRRGRPPADAVQEAAGAAAGGGQDAKSQIPDEAADVPQAVTPEKKAAAQEEVAEADATPEAVHEAPVLDKTPPQHQKKPDSATGQQDIDSIFAHN